jgi:hypothetical protein
MEPDTEALLINRVREASDYYPVPIDNAGVGWPDSDEVAWAIRGRRGLETIREFFAELKEDQIILLNREPDGSEGLIRSRLAGSPRRRAPALPSGSPLSLKTMPDLNFE